MSQSTKSTRSRMIAHTGAPYIGVYALAQFIFCPRAGLLAMGKDEEAEEHENTARLSFTPRWFSEYEIIQQLKRALRLFWGGLFVAIGLGLLLWFIGVAQRLKIDMRAALQNRQVFKSGSISITIITSFPLLLRLIH